MAMSTTTTEPTAVGTSFDSKKILTRCLWALVLVSIAYFVLRDQRFFVFSAEAYGPYYWPRVGILLPHIAAGLAALLLGPLQFWPRIRNGYLKVHRIIGRTYLVSISVGALGAMALAMTSSRGLAYGSGLFGLSVAWLLTSGMAFAAIRRRNFIQHKQWMIRSYVVTFAFVTFRLVNEMMAYFGIGDIADRRALMAWACWAVPLLVAEMLIQGRQVFVSGSRRLP